MHGYEVMHILRQIEHKTMDKGVLYRRKTMRGSKITLFLVLDLASCITTPGRNLLIELWNHGRRTGSAGGLVGLVIISLSDMNQGKQVKHRTNPMRIEEVSEASPTQLGQDERSKFDVGCSRLHLPQESNHETARNRYFYSWSRKVAICK